MPSHDVRGRPIAAHNRPEKVERGRRLVESIKGKGASVPLPPRPAFEAILRDLQQAETLPEWEIDKAARVAATNGSRVPPTPRQIEYAQAYANGDSAVEAARRLGVATESISKGFERLVFNLGARTRYQAVAMLVYAGYITAPPLPHYARTGRGERAPLLHSQHRAVRRSKTLLTEGELATLQLIAGGFTNDQIASSRDVSVETVKSQVGSLIRKLDAKNRVHAVTIAFQQGILA